MPFKWKYDNILYKKNTTFLWYSFESCSFGIAFGLCIVRFKCLGGSSWTFFAGLVFFSLLSFKSVSILSSRSVCVLIQFGLWPINQFSVILGLMEHGFLLKHVLSYTFAAWGRLIMVAYMKAIGAASLLVTLIGDQEFWFCCCYFSL